MPTNTRYPLAPLAEALHLELGQIGGQTGRWHDTPLEGHTALAEAFGCTTRRIRQYALHGLTPLCADRCAVAIGHHPADLWPTWWDDAPDEGDDWYSDDPTLDQLHHALAS